MSNIYKQNYKTQFLISTLENKFVISESIKLEITLNLT